MSEDDHLEVAGVRHDGVAVSALVACQHAEGRQVAGFTLLYTPTVMYLCLHPAGTYCVFISPYPLHCTMDY